MGKWIDEKKQGKEAEVGLEKFFRNLLFWNGGIYTLLGTKPITTFDVFGVEEVFSEDVYQDPNLIVYINKDKEKDRAFYKKLCQNKIHKEMEIIFLSDEDDILDDFGLWTKWEKFSHGMDLSSKYLLFKKAFSPEEEKYLRAPCKKGYHIVFVNVIETAYLLPRSATYFLIILNNLIIII